MQKFTALLATGLLIATPAQADWSAAAQAAARYSDNVGNAGDSEYKRSDEIIAARLSLFDVLPLGSAYLLSAGGDVGGQWFDRLSGLRNGSIDGALSLRRRWGLGAFAPWVRAALSVSRTEYDLSLRNSTGYRASLSGGRRLDGHVNVWVDYTYEHREAKITGEEVPGFSADVFSGNAQSLGVTVDFTPLNRVFLSSGIAARRGDVQSTSEADSGVYFASRAIVEDLAFGREWYTYRLIGNSYTLRAGAAYQLTEHSLLSLDVQHARTYAGGYFYRVTVPEVSWDYRF